MGAFTCSRCRTEVDSIYMYCDKCDDKRDASRNAHRKLVKLVKKYLGGHNIKINQYYHDINAQLDICQKADPDA